MRRIFAIAARDLRSLVVTPLAWVALAVLQGVCAFVFLSQIDRFLVESGQAGDDAPGVTAFIVAPLLGAIASTVLFLLPQLTMRLIAEEKRSGTFTLLRASPASSLEIVLGKFFGLQAFLLGLLVLFSAMPLSLLAGGDLDFGQFGSGILGLVLLFSAFGAVGLFLSTATSQPAIAAILGYGVLLVLLMVDLWAGLASEDFRSVLETMSLLGHLNPLLRGLFRSSDVGYFVLVTALFLTLATLTLEAESRSPPSSARRDLGSIARALVAIRRTSVVVIAIASAAVALYLIARNDTVVDLTAAGRHTLSPVSRELLSRLQQPLRVTAYLRPASAQRERILELIERYRRQRPDIELAEVNPDAVPSLLRERGLVRDGAVEIRYGERSSTVVEVDEASLSTALQRLLRGGERWVAFIDGHGERDAFGRANFDLGDWVQRVSARGFEARSLRLTQAGEVPDNTSLLVIAGPQVDVLPAEVAAIQRYVRRGGNLLWLIDPGELHGLGPLAADLGVRLRAGTLVDASARTFGIASPTIVVVSDYGSHPALAGFRYVTLFPETAALELVPGTAWKATTLLRTSSDAWLESDAVTGTVRFDAGRDTRGPLDIGVALTRTDATAASSQQRIVVIGDGDFLSNAYLGNGGNVELGLRLVNWLVGDDRLIDIPARTTADAHLELSRAETIVIGFGFLLLLPALLAIGGALVWLRRRHL